VKKTIASLRLFLCFALKKSVLWTQVIIILVYLLRCKMVKAVIVLKKCENTESKISSANTVKPYDSMIHGHCNRMFD